MPDEDGQVTRVAGQTGHLAGAWRGPALSRAATSEAERRRLTGGGHLRQPPKERGLQWHDRVLYFVFPRSLHVTPLARYERSGFSSFTSDPKIAPFSPAAGTRLSHCHSNPPFAEECCRLGLARLA